MMKNLVKAHNPSSTRSLYAFWVVDSTLFISGYGVSALVARNIVTRDGDVVARLWMWI